MHITERVYNRAWGMAACFHIYDRTVDISPKFSFHISQQRVFLYGNTLNMRVLVCECLCFYFVSKHVPSIWKWMQYFCHHIIKTVSMKLTHCDISKLKVVSRIVENSRSKFHKEKVEISFGHANWIQLYDLDKCLKWRMDICFWMLKIENLIVYKNV